MKKAFSSEATSLSDEQVDELRSELARVIDDYEKPDVQQPVHIVNLGGREESPVWQVVNIWEASSAYHRLVYNPIIVEEIGQLDVNDGVACLARPDPIQTAASRGCQHVASGFALLADPYSENESGQCLGCVG